jgi:hypothetical protein
VGSYKPDAPSPDAARACADLALADHAPFWVSVDEPVADARVMTGYASDGTTSWLIHYSESIPPTGIGPIDDGATAMTCSALAVGPPCATIESDLCIACADPQPATVTCPKPR